MMSRNSAWQQISRITTRRKVNKLLRNLLGGKSAHLFHVFPVVTMNATKNKSAGTSTAASTIMHNNSILSGPASQALSDFADRLPEPEYLKRTMIGQAQPGGEPSCSRKRRKSSIDMDSLLESIKPVEDSIAFPVIEWVYDDDDNEDEPRNSSRSCCVPDTAKSTDGVELSSWERLYASTSQLGKRSYHTGLIRSKYDTISLASEMLSQLSQSDRRPRSDGVTSFPTKSSLTMLSLRGSNSAADAVAAILVKAVNA